MNSTESKQLPPYPAPTAQSMCAFLAEYATRLFSSGATCIRLEKNVTRIAAAFGMEAEMSILPRHISISVVCPGSGHSFTSVSAIREYPISFAVNAGLSRLSWDIADNHPDFSIIQQRFAEICSSPAVPRGALLLLVPLANAAFCRLFGGDAVAMAVVFAATYAGYLFKQLLGERGIDYRLTVIICAFISSVLAAADGLFGLGTTPQIAVGTAVLYLVPGIPFINSFCDMLDRHYLCAFGRMTHALVITACLSLGLCGGMMLMGLSMF